MRRRHSVPNPVAADLAAFREDLDQQLGRVVGPGDHVHGHELADAGGRHRPGVRRRLDRRHVAADEDRHEPALGILLLENRHRRRLDHRIGGLGGADEPLRLDQPERASRHRQYLTGSR
jgi:hypothetical protein